MKRLMLAVVVLGLIAWKISPVAQRPSQQLTQLPSGIQISATTSSTVFGNSVTYQEPVLTVSPDLSKDFALTEAKNLLDIERAYHIQLSPAEQTFLAQNKFLLKQVPDTSIKPVSESDQSHEFPELYAQVEGPRDYKARGPQNAEYFSSDVFFDAYNKLYTELLKEMENKVFYPAMKSLAQNLYQASTEKLAAAKTAQDINTWIKVRNYFVVPYVIFSTAAQPLTAADYMRNGQVLDPAKVQADYNARDAQVDTLAQVSAAVKALHLDTPSEQAVLGDLASIYSASGTARPQVFSDEYAAYTQQVGVDFSVDFSQFTPRGTYTSSSLRRQYFRGMKWFIDLPFFVKSPALTSYAFAVTQLLAEHPQALQDYNKLESAINFMVGTSDDLMPVDYLQALQAAQGTTDPSSAALAYLVKARDPKIKDLAVSYSNVGVEQSADVLLNTKGMRFFSGKFILDSYWTGYLTQGDEAPRPGYTQKLPPMASALEVMSLLGSDTAKSLIPTLDFYKPTNAQAIQQALDALQQQENLLQDADWQQNLYTAWLWTIKGLFGWEKTQHDLLPRFMQSPMWSLKTLQTASAFWTDLRHATILYAKQSFAEKGGGGDPSCDPRLVPSPPKAYIEPQLTAYARLEYLAKRTDQGLKDQGYQLNNLQPLEQFISLMDTVQSYTQKELGNQTLSEQVVSSTRPDPNDPTKTCVEYSINGASDWEAMRLGIVDGLVSSEPTPVEGPVLPASDRRTALVADVHTGGDSSYPKRILYEATGVPYVALVAVKDVNGPRLTVGFVSSQYEFTQLFGGQRMTDGDWQKNFYVGDNPDDPYTYTSTTTWPQINAWDEPLVHVK